MIDDTSKEFISRHIGPSIEEQKDMLKAISSKSIDNLIENTCLLYTSDAADE